MPNDILSTRIEKIMTKQVTIVLLDDSLEKVREIFNHNSFHHLLVVHEGKLVGVISDRDLLKEISPFLDTIIEQRRDLDHMNKRVHAFMSRDLVTIDKRSTIRTAAKLLMAKRVSCLPVVTPKKYVEGIITWKDILHYLVLGIKMQEEEELKRLQTIEDSPKTSNDKKKKVAASRRK